MALINLRFPMKHILFVSALCALFFVNGTAQAANVTADAKRLYIDGKALMPVCFEPRIYDDKEWIAISGCKSTVDRGESTEDKTEKMDYEIVGKIDDNYVIMVSEDIGRTIANTLLVGKIEVKDNIPQLHIVNDFGQGDTVLGGYHDARVEDKKIKYRKVYGYADLMYFLDDDLGKLISNNLPFYTSPPVLGLDYTADATSKPVLEKSALYAENIDSKTVMNLDKVPLKKEVACIDQSIMTLFPNQGEVILAETDKNRLASSIEKCMAQ